MPTLTAPEITWVRRMTGDNCPDYDVDDEFMQWIYDNKASTKPLCMSDDPLGSLILWVMKARVARAIPLFDEDGDGGTRSVSQKYNHLVKELERMERDCGLGGGLITISTFDLGLDADCSGSEYASRLGLLYWGGYL